MHADAGDLADSLAELPEASLVSSPQSVREVLLGEDPPERRTSHAPASGEGMSGIVYPEWDYREARYKRNWSWVQEKKLAEWRGLPVGQFTCEARSGVIDGAEVCDGQELGAGQCTDFPGLGGGSLACTADCTLDTSGCCKSAQQPCMTDGECCPGTACKFDLLMAKKVCK